MYRDGQSCGSFLLENVKHELEKTGREMYSYVLPAGEENKNLEKIQGIYEFLIKNHFDRKDLLAALGGGVVGDMTGFAAATYLRGIDLSRSLPPSWPRWTAV